MYAINLRLDSSILVLNLINIVSFETESTSVVMGQRNQSVHRFILLLDSFAVLGNSFVHERTGSLSARGLLSLLEGVTNFSYLLVAICELEVLAGNAIYFLGRVALFDMFQSLLVALVVSLDYERLFALHELMFIYIGRLINVQLQKTITCISKK